MSRPRHALRFLSTVLALVLGTFMGVSNSLTAVAAPLAVDASTPTTNPFPEAISQERIDQVRKDGNLLYR